jgi:hypothetical protein
MTITRSSVIALIGLSLAGVGGVGGLLVRIAWPAPILPTTFGVGSNALVVIAWLGITWSAVGALLEVRRPDLPIGRVMILVGCGLALSVLTVAVAFAALAEGSAGGREVASIAGAVTSLVTPVLVFLFYLPFIFPTGRGQSARWDTIGRIFLSVALGSAALLVVQPGDVHLLPGIHNPVGFGPDLRPVFGDAVAGGVDAVAIAILSPLLVLSVASRYRLAGPIERQQLKWFLSAIAVTVVAVTIMFLAAILTKGPIGETPLIVFALAAMTVPLAIGIGILRYRLFEIDRIISRSIAYAMVTVVMLTVLGIGIVGLQWILTPVTGGDALAVAGSTLVVATLFNPLRTRVQSWVDRRFHRARYDTDLTIQRFSRRLRDELDLTTLTGELQRATVAAVEPASTAVWLRSADGQ